MSQVLQLSAEGCAGLMWVPRLQQVNWAQGKRGNVELYDAQDYTDKMLCDLG